MRLLHSVKVLLFTVLKTKYIVAYDHTRENIIKTYICALIVLMKPPKDEHQNQVTKLMAMLGHAERWQGVFG